MGGPIDTGMFLYRDMIVLGMMFLYRDMIVLGMIVLHISRALSWATPCPYPNTSPYSS